MVSGTFRSKYFVPGLAVAFKELRERHSLTGRCSMITVLSACWNGENTVSLLVLEILLTTGMRLTVGTRIATDLLSRFHCYTPKKQTDVILAFFGDFGH